MMDILIMIDIMLLDPMVGIILVFQILSYLLKVG